jgi:hypothetical protein
VHGRQGLGKGCFTDPVHQEGTMMFAWSTAALFEWHATRSNFVRRSVPQIKISELRPVEKYDLALVVANKSDDVEVVQP